MEKFKVIEWRTKPIEKVEIIKESEHFVWIKKDVREAKNTKYHQYFDSYSEAKAYLVQKQDKEISKLKIKIKELESKLQKYLNL